jgi:hypothetical protein
MMSENTLFIRSAVRMANQKRKRNHWVPQAYLRTFAADPGRKKIWRLGKEAGEPESKPIEKVAVSFYLYAPKGPHGRDYRFEEKLASLEKWFGESFWVEASTGHVDLCNKFMRKGLSLLTAVMYMRNPLYFAMIKDMHRQFVAMFSEFSELPDEFEIAGRKVQVDKESWPACRDASDDDIKQMWLDDVGMATWPAELMTKMRWAVLLANAPVFVTSDNPVVLLHPSLGFRGLNDPETTLMFPLSPTHVLVMDNRHSEPDGQYYPLKRSAADLNGLLWRNAIEFLFSPRHPDSVCEELCTNAKDSGFRWTPDAWRARR